MGLFRKRNLKRMVHIGEGMLVGFLSGMAVVLYGYLLEKVFVESRHVLTLAHGSVFTVLGWQGTSRPSLRPS